MECSLSTLSFRPPLLVLPAQPRFSSVRRAWRHSPQAGSESACLRATRPAAAQKADSWPAIDPAKVARRRSRQEFLVHSKLPAQNSSAKLLASILKTKPATRRALPLHKVPRVVFRPNTRQARRATIARPAIGETSLLN